MAQIGNIPEIIEVKEHLENIKQDGLITEWELPYENLLTRRSAAIFFLTASGPDKLSYIWEQLSRYPDFRYSDNEDKKLSSMQYRIEFNNENI